MVVMKFSSYRPGPAALAALFALLAGATTTARAEEPGFGIGGHVSPESYPGMALAWREEFSAGSLDGRSWKFETGTGDEVRASNALQYYRPDNAGIRDGFLVITAREEPFGGRDYTSARIVTRGLQDFRFGRIDIRAKLPRGQGMWPAVRMLGTSLDRVGWPACGAIDIMEMAGGRGRENTVRGMLHWQQDGGHVWEGGSFTLPTGDFSEQFHVFSVTRDDSTIRWLVDGQVYLQRDISLPAFDAIREPFFLMIQLAVGGDWPGGPDGSTLFPQRLIVDYIRVFH
jgi:beta-glucanase (GH16 family)